MKAAIREKYGSIKFIKIAEIPIPQAQANEVLVAVKATSINRTDCAVATGIPFVMRFFTGLFRPKKQIIGTDFAGEIVEIGKEVSLFKTGDRVMGFYDEGICSQAEYMTIKENFNLVHIPDKLSFMEAAACLEATHYAYNIIKSFKFKKGDKILINGATGGIGSALLQFVKKQQVFVTAVCNTKNIALIKKLGADKIIDYQQDDFTKDDLKYNYIFDAVGKSTFSKCKPLLYPKGIYTSTELGPYWQNPFLAILGKFKSGKKVLFPIPIDIKLSLKYIVEMIESKQYIPVIEKTVSLNEIQEAYEYVNAGLKTGNVVLLINK